MGSLRDLLKQDEPKDWHEALVRELEKRVRRRLSEVRDRTVTAEEVLSEISKEYSTEVMRWLVEAGNDPRGRDKKDGLAEESEDSGEVS